MLSALPCKYRSSVESNLLARPHVLYPASVANLKPAPGLKRCVSNKLQYMRSPLLNERSVLRLYENKLALVNFSYNLSMIT